ncbi:dehydrogenase/reductase SDR family member 13-like [Clavelina lepadiformis]|uniref:dehydrogenase/reductase SDR family member 13-like n=1 Tax=Clavelina lepadiformis TaxID=159417 RepID=UPI0040424F53
MQKMWFNLLVSAAIAAVVGYYWLNYVKKGPIYESDKKLNGKTVLITGGNCGMGRLLAMDLAKRGARVVIASRNLEKSNKVKDEIIKESGNHEVRAMQVDLEDFDSVRKFAKEFDESEKYLDYLLNNAGMVLEGMTKYGINRIFVVNYFSRFLLTNLLLDKMKKQSAERPVRIINLISDMYKYVDFDESDMTRDSSGFMGPFIMYGKADLADVRFLQNLTRKLKGYDITAQLFNPGYIMSEGLSTYYSFRARMLSHVLIFLMGQDAYHGYQPYLKLVLDDSLVKHKGGFFNTWTHEEWLPHATKESAWEPLMRKSLEVTGLSST